MQKERIQRMENYQTVTFSSQIKEIDKYLDDFIIKTKSVSIILITKDGQLITSRGDVSFINTTALAALVAGSFAATKEVASLLGEREFSILLQQGEKRHVHISLLGSIAMMVVVFENLKNVGKVRFYAKEASQKVTESLVKGGKREEERVKVELSNFKEYATNLIDTIFSDSDSALIDQTKTEKKEE